jgi:hypothetical protein
MSLKPQSIRKGITITLNGKEVEKQEIIDLSVDWTESQINFFKKMLKQGGRTKINGSAFDIIIQAKVLNSRGEKDPGIIIMPGIDDRF